MCKECLSSLALSPDVDDVRRKEGGETRFEAGKSSSGVPRLGHLRINLIR